MGLIVLCFAQAGSRVSLTGGPYAYVELALGKYVGFLVGTLLWLVGTTAMAAVGSAFIGSIAVFWAPLAQPAPRALILATVFVLFGALNIRGTKQSTRFIEIVTVVKLLPLIVFVIVGAILAHGPAVEPALAKTLGQALGQRIGEHRLELRCRTLLLLCVQILFQITIR